MTHSGPHQRHTFFGNFLFCLIPEDVIEGKLREQLSRLIVLFSVVLDGVMAGGWFLETKPSSHATQGVKLLSFVVEHRYLFSVVQPECYKTFFSFRKQCFLFVYFCFSRGEQLSLGFIFFSQCLAALGIPRAGSILSLYQMKGGTFVFGNPAWVGLFFFFFKLRFDLHNVKIT